MPTYRLVYITGAMRSIALLFTIGLELPYARQPSPARISRHLPRASRHGWLAGTRRLSARQARDIAVLAAFQNTGVGGYYLCRNFISSMPVIHSPSLPGALGPLLTDA